MVYHSSFQRLHKYHKNIHFQYYPLRKIQSISLLKDWSPGRRQFVMSPLRAGDNSFVHLWTILLVNAVNISMNLNINGCK
jgi:hypothetical protein